MDGFNLPEKLKHSLFCDTETRFCYKIMDVEKNIVFKTVKMLSMVGISNGMKLQKKSQIFV